MGKFKALLLAGVASFAAMAQAHAADLLLPPPPPVEPVYTPVAIGGSWYLRGDVGAGITQLSGLRNSFNEYIPDFSQDGYSVKESAILGLGAGYQLNNWFRADVTGEYRTGARYRAYENYSGSPNCPTGSGYLCLDGYSATVRSAVFLVNGYVQLGTWYGITPYVGAGVGTSINTFAGLTDYGITNPGASGQAADHTSPRFAYALMAGFSYDLTQNLKLDIGYRYLDMGRLTSNPIICTAGCTNEVQSYHLTSHDIRLGLRYVFSDLVPAPQIPLVRKY